MGNGKKTKDKDKDKAGQPAPAAPVVTAQAAGPASTAAPERGPNGFELDDPVLPDWIRKAAFGSGRYPYKDALSEDDYLKTLVKLQIELVKLQRWTIDQGHRVVMVFEGRDAAGKGGAIGAFREYMSPRATRVVALSKPTEIEKGQWYFQRYVQPMPTRGEIVLFDRSWYNRGGVEPVMGFCTPEQNQSFLREAPRFERMLVHDGVHLIKIWIDVGFEMQLKRFHDRRHNPLKVWKISPIDYAAINRYDAYGTARNTMMAATHQPDAPWLCVLGNDKKRARISALRHVLGLFDYPGKDKDGIGEPDPVISSIGPKVLDGR